MVVVSMKSLRKQDGDKELLRRKPDPCVCHACASMARSKGYDSEAKMFLSGKAGALRRRQRRLWHAQA